MNQKDYITEKRKWKHHREELFGEMVQKVEIYYKMIGYVELPEMSESEKESLMKSFGRTEMSQSA